MGLEPTRLTISEAARRLGRSYRATLDAVLRGEIEGRQDAKGRWSLSEADVARCERERAVRRAIEPTALADALGHGVYESLARMHTIGKAMAGLQLEFDSRLEALRADAAEEEQRGDTARADELRALAEDMSKATYGIDRVTGKFVLGIRQDDGSVLVPAPEQPA